MADQTFTVTLPSNSNMKSHPSNRGCKYTVKLGAPINFGGQTLNDDVNWEVALASVQYTNRFYDVRTSATIYVHVVYPNLQAITVTGNNAPPGLTQYSEHINANNLKRLDAIEQRLLKPYVASHENTTSAFVVSGKITVPAGHYADVSAVYNFFVSEFNKLFGGPRYKTTMSASIRESSDMVKFEIYSNGGRLTLYTDSPTIVNLLGMTAKEIDDEKPTIYKITHVGTQPPRFDSIQSLYVYSDIVKPQHVGDTLAPLLEIVPVQGIPGQRVHYCFNPLTYLPVNRTFIESIDTEICDEYGNHVVFSDNVENVVCRLRFRHSKNNTLIL